MYKMDKRLLGIVIIYYPKIEIIKNIESYLCVVEKLIIWDNTPNGFNDFDLPNNGKIEIIGDKVNRGIGIPLNIAVEIAKKEGYTHVLSMDQDSYFEYGECSVYWTAILEKGDIAIYSPNYCIDNNALFAQKQFFTEVEKSMTSGSIYPVNLFEIIGVFRDDLFIDLIDTEISLRAKRHNIKTWVYTPVCLNHKLGNKGRICKLLWKQFNSNEYSPLRTYYIVRNGIIVKKEYPLATCWDSYFSHWIYNRLLLIVFFENQKFKKIRCLFMGVFHGLVGRTGSYYK